jgi:hypothetical protein
MDPKPESSAIGVKLSLLCAVTGRAHPAATSIAISHLFRTLVFSPSTFFFTVRLQRLAAGRESLNSPAVYNIRRMYSSAGWFQN